MTKGRSYKISQLWRLSKATVCGLQSADCEMILKMQIAFIHKINIVPTNVDMLGTYT